MSAEALICIIIVIILLLPRIIKKKNLHLQKDINSSEFEDNDRVSLKVH